MGTFYLYAYGTHCQGIPNFGYTGFALFTNGVRGLHWYRIGGTHESGEITTSDDAETTKAYQAILVNGQAKFREHFQKHEMPFFAPFRAEAFGFTGNVLSDFSDDVPFFKFKDFRKHIGMPEGVVQQAAMQILRIRE